MCVDIHTWEGRRVCAVFNIYGHLPIAFLGLHTEPGRRTQNTTLEEGYEDLRKSASKFLTIQIGIATFKFDPSNGSYLAKPFNIFVFPTTLTGYSPQGRCFLTEASSLDFLAKNRFDFNKWVYQGNKSFVVAHMALFLLR